MINDDGDAGGDVDGDECWSNAVHPQFDFFATGNENHRR